MEMTFEEGEEKLARAYELIAATQEALFALKARMDVDALVLGALIATHPEPGRLFELWTRMSSESLPEELTRTFGAPTNLQLMRDAMNQRSAFWTEALHKAAHGPASQE